MFLSLAAFFALGVSPRFARRFYPEAPSFRRRLAAPALFTMLALACFAGMALPALVASTAFGGAAVFYHRRQRRTPAGSGA